MSSVALAGCTAIADPDLATLLDALGRAGLDAVALPWDDPASDFAGRDVTVIRSTWGYDASLEAYLAWTSSIPRLCNPAAVVRWNSDKRYLDDLAAAGVPTIPTAHARSGATAQLPSGPVVVKPAVGGGARGVARFAAHEHDLARAHVDALVAAGRLALVQPLVESLVEVGETDVIVIDGVVSHTVDKHVAVGNVAATSPSGAATVSRATPSAAQLEVVAAALAAAPFDEALCYARVDLADVHGGPCVLELELIEPYLFLGECPEAPDRLAAAIAARAAP